MNIDRERLRADIDALARDCRAVKDILGTTWTRPMADEQRKLVRLRRRVTELHVLVARLRGKHHVTRAWTEQERETWHAAIAERVAKDYTSTAAASAGEEAR
ncbi:MAG: hypothetical protein KF819_13815 [Labilithrix sp.]|nr:hypothetical protein [Labilithrix sp.]